MRRMYDYRCNSCKTEFEALISEHDRTLGCECPNCGGWGDYIVSSPKIGAWLDSDQWVKNRESHMKQERKNLREHGDYNNNKRHV